MHIAAKQTRGQAIGVPLTDLLKGKVGADAVSYTHLAKTEYAEITYTINGQVQDTLRYSTDDMDIISIKNPEKEYSIHVAYYDNDGNKYE